MCTSLTALTHVLAVKCRQPHSNLMMAWYWPKHTCVCRLHWSLCKPAKDALLYMYYTHNALTGKPSRVHLFTFMTVIFVVPALWTNSPQFPRRHQTTSESSMDEFFQGWFASMHQCMECFNLLPLFVGIVLALCIWNVYSRS